MSVDCYCHRDWHECPVMYHGKPNYPVPALKLEVIPVFWSDPFEMVALDLVDTGHDVPWPVVAAWEYEAETL